VRPRWHFIVRQAILALAFLAGCAAGLAIAVLTGLVRLRWLQ
jgi:hypothetical protein